MAEHLPPEVSHETPLHQVEFAAGDTYLEILTFEDDRLAKLDSYQRIHDFEGNTAYVESTGGEKIIFLCTCGPHRRHEWAQISSYGALCKTYVQLKDECREHLTRTGECRTTAGSSSGHIDLRPLVCNIQIDAISYDFSGTPYSGSHITDLRAYLINVNSSCPLTSSSPEKPVQIINQGKLLIDDVDDMADPAIIYAELAKRFDSGMLKPGYNFLCMPNIGTEGNPGNPPTRLVLEGKIDGHIYYWPINIGHEAKEGTYVAERNHSYIYDIHIRRKGTSDPDIPISIKTGEIKLKVESWIEKKEYGIEF